MPYSRFISAGVLLSTLVLCGLSRDTLAQELKEYETTYYTIHTDLPEEAVREASTRMTRMVEEYMDRTRDFSGQLRGRMPFYLYKDADAYYATGAPKSSAGYFNGQELVALASELGPRTWHTVQHEGFHQFAAQVIHGDLPPWLGEGLAEYFGEAIFTGDGYVSGVIPQWRLDRIRQTLKAGTFRPLPEMMALSLQEWNDKLAIINYDLGWSMVQFLAHGGSGKYQRAFGAFIAEISRGQNWQPAWRNNFGPEEYFDTPWRSYWTQLPDNSTQDLYARANLATLTSYLARAATQKQTFASFDAFKAAAEKGELKSSDQDWLPPSLLSYALEQNKVLTSQRYNFVLSTTRNSANIRCVTPSGLNWIGQYQLQGDHVVSVTLSGVGSRRRSGG